MERVELHIFSGASDKGIAAVVYVLAYDMYANRQIGFVIGKSKVAPEKGHTILDWSCVQLYWQLNFLSLFRITCMLGLIKQDFTQTARLF